MHRHSLLLIIGTMLATGCSTDAPLRLPGALGDGRILLPNGWTLSPAGRSVPVGELPLNMALTPDGNHLIVTNNGTGAQSLTVIETSGWKVLQTLPVSKSWLGMRLARDGKTLYLSGGNDNRVLVYAFEAGTLTLEDSIRLGSPRPQQKIWTGGMDLDEGSGRLYVVGRESDSIYAVSLASRAVVRRAALPARPYTCLLAGKVLYVTLWGGSAVAMLDPETLALTGTITVGDHPCDIIAHPRDGRLFVANANHNTVSVIDPARGKVIETITTSLTPTAPAGSTPNALALDARRGRLFVANADNNYLAVFDVEQPGRSRAVGFIPTGWYPTAVRYEARSNTILVANGKGSGSRANPGGPNPTVRNAAEEYIGSMFAGTVSAIPDPGDSILAHHTLQVYQNSPCTDARRDRGARPADNPVPGGRGGGERSPIRHVFYIIKENRTYDQVFGDMSEGNGDPSLCLFPDSVTPNHHALAREFVLLDNFYCDAEVSADGHNWSMGAYATDYVEKSWPTMYGGRGGEYDFQGGAPIAAPSGGYLWDNCRRHGVTYRSYGEWADNPARPGDSAKALAPALVGHVAPFYIGWDMSFSDVDRAKLWMAEFDEFERNGNLPQFQVITLPNDHTEGTRRGSLTPQAYVAQNDLALGMIVERISRSRYWKESAIFVVEDDAQNGPDHVDAHRTVALVISPWTKRRVVDSELYSTTSMVRTMELILGLPPMSQFDAASTPMYGSFSSTADLTPYRCRPARIDITRRNPAGAYGQERSGELDFSKEDRVPDVEFSEIIWKAVRGADSPMPPPVRSAFVRVLEEDEE